DDLDHFHPVEPRRQVRQEIDRWVEQLSPGQALQPDPDGLDIQGEDDAEQQPRDRTDDADAGAAQKEDAQNHAAGRTHGAQDRDVAALVLHEHDHRRDDVERRYQDDQGQDQEHDVAFDLNRGEET